jgi:hypothetical protein
MGVFLGHIKGDAHHTLYIVSTKHTLLAHTPENRLHPLFQKVLITRPQLPQHCQSYVGSTNDFPLYGHTSSGESAVLVQLEVRVKYYEVLVVKLGKTTIYLQKFAN